MHWVDGTEDIRKKVAIKQAQSLEQKENLKWIN
jgi:hypothetical protein